MNQQLQTHPNDEKGVIPIFYVDAVEDKFQTAKQGRPIYRDTEMIRILIPGDKNTEFVAPVRQEHIDRFPHQYARFKSAEGDREAVVGTPLSEWPRMTPALIKEWEYFNITTVEHVANLSDQHIQNLGPGTRDHVEAAKTFLAKAEDNKVPEALAVENAQLREDMKAMREQMADMAAQMAESKAADKPPKKAKPIPQDA